jgi:hypothetical protein
LPLPLVHLAFCAYVPLGTPSEGSWGWVPLFAAEFPVSIPLLFLGSAAGPLVTFGVVGTALWFLINRAVVAFVAGSRRWHGAGLLKKMNDATRWPRARRGAAEQRGGRKGK